MRELITPVILSGGLGTRLWPLSRTDRPKQLLPITGSLSMLQLTVQRVADARRFSDPVIVANATHADEIDSQMSAIGVAAAKLILEPCGRNTAAAIALAAHGCEAEATLLLVMPSDHVIGNVGAFLDAVEKGLPLARLGWLVTFGIEPGGLETGYGYIKLGESLGDGAFRAARFVEKPDRASALAMIAEGKHVWNGGMFLFRADSYLTALARHEPAVEAATRQAMKAASDDGARLLPDQASFSASPSTSIDYAVLEKAENVAVVRASMDWSDVGSWDALYELGDRDELGNVIQGNVVAVDTSNCLLRSDGPRIAVTGVTDLIVVASGDDILITPRGASQHVRKLTAKLTGTGES